MDEKILTAVKGLIDACDRCLGDLEHQRDWGDSPPSPAGQQAEMDMEKYSDELKAILGIPKKKFNPYAH